MVAAHRAAANNSDMANPRRPLDSRIEIITPENIAFQYVLAGPFRRLPAYLIDCALCIAVLVGTLVLLSLSATFAGILTVGIGLWLVFAFVLSWFYFSLFETFWNGQTPGKRLLGLRVLSVDGQPINALQAIVRNIVRNLDAMPMLGANAELGVPFYMVGLLAMAANDRYQRLGDLAGGTIVVVEKRSALGGLTPMRRGDVLAFAQNIPVQFVTGRALAQALSIYVARRERFSAARRFEIARVLAEPFCERFDLPEETDPDLLLCALYYRTFIADRPGRDASGPVAVPAVAEGAGR
jgi:uncharacterized RDD family membrane protein YckC